MTTSRGRPALDSWLADAEEVLAEQRERSISPSSYTGSESDRRHESTSTVNAGGRRPREPPGSTDGGSGAMGTHHQRRAKAEPLRAVPLPRRRVAYLGGHVERTTSTRTTTVVSVGPGRRRRGSPSSAGSHRNRRVARTGLRSGPFSLHRSTWSPPRAPHPSRKCSSCATTTRC